nr:hypothetical protein [uncultured Hyphomonas sp.]
MKKCKDCPKPCNEPYFSPELLYETVFPRPQRRTKSAPLYEALHQRARELAAPYRVAGLLMKCMDFRRSIQTIMNESPRSQLTADFGPQPGLYVAAAKTALGLVRSELKDQHTTPELFTIVWDATVDKLSDNKNRHFGVSECALKYDPAHDTSARFMTFAISCVKNRALDLIRQTVGARIETAMDADELERKIANSHSPVHSIAGPHRAPGEVVDFERVDRLKGPRVQLQMEVDKLQKKTLAPIIAWADKAAAKNLLIDATAVLAMLNRRDATFWKFSEPDEEGPPACMGPNRSNLAEICGDKRRNPTQWRTRFKNGVRRAAKQSPQVRRQLEILDEALTRLRALQMSLLEEEGVELDRKTRAAIAWHHQFFHLLEPRDVLDGL